MVYGWGCQRFLEMLRNFLNLGVWETPGTIFNVLYILPTSFNMCILERHVNNFNDFHVVTPENMIDQLQNKITKFKTGFTTRCSDPSYPKVLYNSMYPSLRYAMDKFRDEKEENRKKTSSKQ